jgi:hypothetical protein
MKLTRFLLPRLEYILFAAIFWGIASTGPILLNSDGDLPRHLLVGKLIRMTREVGLTDIFSFRTTGFPSFPHEWLSQVILSGFYDLMGLGGVVFFTAAIITIIWAIIFYDALHRSNSLIISIIFTGLGVGASLIHILPRPHLFSYVFTVLWILVLEKIYKDKPQNWWLLPVLMLIWVNLHGMFVLGIVIWIIYLTGDLFENFSKTWFTSTKTKSMLAGGVLSMIATFLSPSGISIWGAIATLSGDAYIKSRIPEYQSANFQIPETWPFILILLLTMISFARSTNKAPWRHVFLVTAFAGVALYSSRMLPFFAIIAVPITARSISEWLKQDYPNSRLWSIETNINAINQSSNGLIWVLAAVLAVAFLFNANIPIDPGNKGNIFSPQFFPVDAVTWLQSHPQNGHMFNEFDWGGYMLLKLWPAQKMQIFMDGHTHIYGEKLTREYEEVITLSDGWQSIFDKYQITWAIVRDQSPVAKALESQGWTNLYEDKTTVILHHP